MKSTVTALLTGILSLASSGQLYLGGGLTAANYSDAAVNWSEVDTVYPYGPNWVPGLTLQLCYRWCSESEQEVSRGLLRILRNPVSSIEPCVGVSFFPRVHYYYPGIMETRTVISIYRELAVPLGVNFTPVRMGTGSASLDLIFGTFFGARYRWGIRKVYHFYIDVPNPIETDESDFKTTLGVSCGISYWHRDIMSVGIRGSYERFIGQRPVLGATDDLLSISCGSYIKI